MYILILCLLVQGDQPPELGTLAHYETTVTNQLSMCRLMKRMIVETMTLEMRASEKDGYEEISKKYEIKINDFFKMANDESTKSYKALVEKFEGKPLVLLKKAHVKFLAGLATIRTSDIDEALIKKEILELTKEIEIEML